MSQHDFWIDQLSVGLSALNLDVTATQQNKLLEYLQLLEKWNKAYNLTAIRDPQQMVSRQLLDSLSIMPYFNGLNVLDVGTGAGLPGIPLAVVNNDSQITMMDSNGKKTRFVQQAIHQLKLKNAQVVNQRVESYKPEKLFDCITSRAFATLADMIAGSRHLLADDGCWLAMKSRVSEQEVAELPTELHHQIIDLNVPDEEASRQLVIINR